MVSPGIVYNNFEVSMPTFEYTMEVIDSPMVSPGIVYNNFEVSIPTFEYTMEVIDSIKGESCHDL